LTLSTEGRNVSGGHRRTALPEDLEIAADLSELAVQTPLSTTHREAATLAQLLSGPAVCWRGGYLLF